MSGADPSAGAGTRPWVSVRHVAHEGPGGVATALEAAGIGVEEVRIDRGEPLPAADDLGGFGGLVVMGGPMGVGDDDANPWMAPERDLLSAAVARGLPVLGICLGAQQLAAALGAPVTRGGAPEIGPGEDVLTRDGRLDPVFGPEYTGLGDTSVPCIHWHGDTFALPEGAVHLAATRAYPHQAFRVGHRVYGLQFHVEVDEALARAWQPFLPAGVRLGDAEVARIETAGRRLLTRFVSLACAPALPAAER